MPLVKKRSYFKLILILTWSSFFFSINLNPAEFLSYDIISKIRLVLPLFFVFLIIFFKYNEIKFSNFISIHSFLFYSIFFLYIFFNLINPKNNNINIFWPSYMFLSFLFLHIFANNEEKKNLLILTSVIIIFAFAFFFIFVVIKMYENSFLHFYGIYGKDLAYGGFESPPRSSGLARLSLLSYALITFNYLIKKKKNFFLLFLISFFATCTIIFQSRTTSLIYIVISIFIIIFYFDKFFYDKRLLIFSLILPITLNSLYQYQLIKTNIIKSDKQITISGIVQDGLFRDTLSYPENKFIEKDKKLNKFSSDRFSNWNKAHKIIKKNYFKGYGAQADRLLINQSIHNALIYAVLSGGLFAGIAIILIYVYSIYLLIKFYFFTKYKLKLDYLVHFSGSVLIIFGLRSTLETSFAVFSIDYLIYIIAFLFFNNQIRLSKN